VVATTARMDTSHGVASFGMNMHPAGRTQFGMTGRIAACADVRSASLQVAAYLTEGVDELFQRFPQSPERGPG
jgi:hypothetical protein